MPGTEGQCPLGWQEHSHVRGRWGRPAVAGPYLLSAGTRGPLYCPQTPFRPVLGCGQGKRERTRPLRCTPLSGPSVFPRPPSWSSESLSATACWRGRWPCPLCVCLAHRDSEQTLRYWGSSLGPHTSPHSQGQPSYFKAQAKSPLQGHHHCPFPHHALPV